MTDSKHTPGPWVAMERRVLADNVEIVATYLPHVGPSGAREAVANARLIAAAPEMAAEMLKFVARVDAGEVKSKRTYAAFRAILAKAGVA